MVPQDDWFFRTDGGDGADAGDRAGSGDRVDDVTAVAGAPGEEAGPNGRAPRGRRKALVAAGATAAVALGLTAAGAVVVTGLGGPDVVLARAASPVAPEASDGGTAPDGADDAYLASLTAPTETPPPPPPPEPVDVPEPVVRVEPLAPGESYGEDADPWAVAYEVPDVGATWSAALPDGQVGLGDLGQYRFQPTVPGQSCNGGSSSPRSVAGRQWMWAEEDSNRLDQTTVGLVVTGWPEGGGPSAFADVVEDDGPCAWYDDVPSPADVAVPSADEAWAGVRRSPVGDGSVILLGAARTGDLVVGVQVQHPAAGDADALTGRLLEAAVLELLAADPGGAAG
ncbi:hypothetical protein [uncultured Pseudokineococcus sp.]|uniref:hypothetical protein n=1 Tax=uncultured Pseudokineococcus sp. TaxID=1642928 RepID=UPI00261212E4|nr:hypothetical protein [uncultured Pseudokineococcus sp.]